MNHHPDFCNEYLRVSELKNKAQRNSLFLTVGNSEYSKLSNKVYGYSYMYNVFIVGVDGLDSKSPIYYSNSIDGVEGFIEGFVKHKFFSRHVQI